MFNIDNVRKMLVNRTLTYSLHSRKDRRKSVIQIHIVCEKHSKACFQSVTVAVHISNNVPTY